MRPGSELNRARLAKLGVALVHGDIRMPSDFESLPAVDWVIDAAANPSVLAGIQTGFSSRQLIEHNLGSVVNVLEYCKAHKAGLLLMSTSRVYSIPALRRCRCKSQGDAFCLDEAAELPPGISAAASAWTFPRARRFRFMAAPSWRPRRWRWNMATRSTFRFGSTAAACWPGRGSSARRIRACSPIGFTLTRAAGRCASSASMARASKLATYFIRAISPFSRMLR